MNFRTLRRLGVGVAAIGAASSALATDFVSVSTNNVVTFAPAEALSPVITGVVAAVIAGVSLFTLVVGTRWVYRMLKASR